MSIQDESENESDKEPDADASKTFDKRIFGVVCFRWTVFLPSIASQCRW